MNYDAAVAECRERLGKREISDEAARTLCAAWASPGSVGSALAAVATGAWKNSELVACKTYDPSNRDKLTEFRDDLHRTFSDYRVSEGAEQTLIWEALATWACNGADQ